jgi:hypothetical protein
LRNAASPSDSTSRWCSRNSTKVIIERIIRSLLF